MSKPARAEGHTNEGTHKRLKFPAAGNLAANFFVQRANSADSAQNQQISTSKQGAVQGFAGISYLTASHNGIYQGVLRVNAPAAQGKTRESGSLL